MLKFLLNRYITTFERRWGYDARYMRDLIDLSPWVMLKFMLAASAGQRQDAPPAALAAASLVGTLVEDCGPCTQIGVDMAAAGGLPPRLLQAILSGDEAAMGPDAALGYAFARASLARDLEAADVARDEVIRRWGKRGLTTLALALTGARMYPTMKYALGHGRACSRVEVAGAPVPVHRPDLLAA
jgi:hypothetical protein